MTDAHCHVAGGDPTVRELVVGRDFFGIHPWRTLDGEGGLDREMQEVRAALESNPSAGVGEIGLDRLKTREISKLMREVFETQLKFAFELDRPLALHGAKCWGDVVRTVRSMRPAGYSRPILFHGFSRSGGLLPDIAALNGFVSVGPAVLNDHATNYRELVKAIPSEMLLVETDRTSECGASLRDILAKTAELRGVTFTELENASDANADAFFAERNRPRC